MFVNLWRFFFIANLMEGPFIFFVVVISRTTVAEKQRDTTSYRQVETLKHKLMKLRKENEILKRKLSSS